MPDQTETTTLYLSTPHLTTNGQMRVAHSRGEVRKMLAGGGFVEFRRADNELTRDVAAAHVVYFE